MGTVEAPTLIVYHADCPDGFCAAFLALRRFPEARLLPATHGAPPPYGDVRDQHVLVVDFSWKRPVVEALHDEAASLFIIDHHKTAESELAGLDYTAFDLKRSGATLTWDLLFPSKPRPWYVPYVEDRDLARYVLPHSKAISAYIMALPQTVEAWARLDVLAPDFVRQSGEAIRLHIEHYVEKVVAERQMGRLAGYSAAVVNAAYPNISDVAGALCDHAEIGCGWFERHDGLVQFSLRSRDGLDVSLIAQSYGGGGHKNAAGFQLPRPNGYAVLNMILQRSRA
jgi:uncharacterized protein